MFFHGGHRELGVTRIIFGKQDGLDSGHERDLASGSEK
jgi:hypothetical protein